MVETNPPKDTIRNTAIYKRAKPKTPLKMVEEFAKTGNPLAWAIMKAREPHFEFGNHYEPPDGKKGETLEPPIAYGLKHYRERDLMLDSGEHVTAWYKPAKDGYPTIAYCHGNAGSLEMRAAILKEISDRGFGVMIAAYPGFKGHKKRPSIDPSENTCYATGHAMIRTLVNRHHVPMDNILLFGESMGGAVALRTALNVEQGIPDLGYEPDKIPGVICFNTFTSLVDRAKEQFPMLPADMLMDNRFESDKIIGQVQAPVLLLHGKDDEYTPCDHSVRLHEASGGKATLKLLDGVTHSCSFQNSDKKDPRQIRHVVDEAQQFVHGLGLCPPPPARVSEEPKPHTLPLWVDTVQTPHSQTHNPAPER